MAPLTLNADGSFTYTANAGQRRGRVHVQRGDPSGLITNTVTVTLTVKPAATNDSYTTSTGTAVVTTRRHGCARE